MRRLWVVAAAGVALLGGVRQVGAQQCGQPSEVPATTFREAIAKIIALNVGRNTRLLALLTRESDKKKLNFCLKQFNNPPGGG